jgi:hypothetical protein
MMGRFLRMGLVLAWAFPGLLGCEHQRSFFRPQDEADVDQHASQGIGAVDSDPSKIEGVAADGQASGSFFKNNRRTGGLSSEAREIEGHFGIH